ncbi:PhnD/SsuA/transferrin family substrate-binding protein [uncultured Sphaerochaeta sp.]|uniref:phosphate/phosphite/phosphonate ABC transporter substrate-binding protein n=1 Tax=uncultured Sphaerochaeta sp. TaxID=886478 RepID=UPI002A0A13EB|nr:PhnD/SsuA/transferrin family substrate-binding protein [uncultured Sphaerochaeta sp.]
MKRIMSILLVCAVSLTALFAQGGKELSQGTTKEIKTLNVYFVPSREPEEIVTATAPLKQLLKDELANQGYTVDNVVITVGTSYEAVGVALGAGTADVGLIPGGTYVLYDDGADVILTATRDGLSIDSDDPKVWNDNKPTEASTTQAVGYRSLLIAGPSKKGQELAAKVNAGQKLTWDDINSANWAIMGSSSSAGYIYPYIWLMQNYDGKGITDLTHAVQADSYGSEFARLASGQVDVLVTYADARRDYAQKWSSEFGRKASIWDETNVIGVTPYIYNDTISVSKTSKIMTPEFKTALQQAFINIAKTDEGKKVIAIYSHKGYQVATSSDYDNERTAQKIIRETKKN